MSDTPAPKLVLIGYRATGKTTVARLLAEKLGWQWVDTDQLVQQRSGKTIAELFQQQGESGFRRLEHQALQQVLERPEPLVVAAGGGIVTEEENRQLLRRQADWVVWLQAPVEVIAARLQADPASAQTRPSLTGRSITEEVEHVLGQRRVWYASCSQLAIDTGQQEPDEVAAEILRRLELLPPKQGNGQ